MTLQRKRINRTISETFDIQQKLYERIGQETYLVSRSIDGIEKNCIFKKIECQDENFANKAFREVLRMKNALDEVPGVIPVREFRVYWEAKNSSTHICCLRDKYDVGLYSNLQRAYHARSPVKEKAVENYMCQLILILSECHQRNVYHRALKLSNIIKDEELKCVLVADFLIDGTFQTNHIAWQAPELSLKHNTPPDNEKIDVWGIGLIMLCVVSAPYIEPGEKFEEFLMALKTSEEPLENMWAQLTRRYTEDILRIIWKMIEKDPEKRPTLKALKQETYIEMCFKMNDMAEILKDYRKSWIGNFWGMPKYEKLDSVLDFLKTFVDCEDRVTSAFNALNKLFICQNELDLKPEQKQLILDAMRNHPTIHKVQQLGFQLLTKFVSRYPKEDYLFTCQAVRSLISILKIIPKDEVLRTLIYEFLTYLAMSDDAAKSFGSHGGLLILIEMLRAEDDVYLLQISCRALWGLCRQDGNARIAAYEGIPADMCAHLNTNFLKIDVARELIAVLLALSIVPNIINLYCKHHVVYMVISFLKHNEKNAEMIALCCNTLKSFLVHATFQDDLMVQFQKFQVLSLVVSILWKNIEKPGVVESCLTALTAIVFSHEESADIFLITKGEDDKHFGMQLIRKILITYKDNAKVAMCACTFLEAIMKFDEGAKHAVVYHIPPWLTTIKESFSEDKELREICEKLSKRLEKFKDV